MKYKYINKFVDLITEVEDFDKREIVGWTPQQILDIQKVHPAKMGLPMAFQELLIFGGQKIVHWHFVSSFYYSYLIDMNSEKNLNNTFFSEEYFKDFVGSDFKSSFPKDAFIFYDNQDYEYQYIRLSEGQDPPVYFFDDDPEHLDFEKQTNTFSEWLYKQGKIFVDFHNKWMVVKEEFRYNVNAFKTQLLNTIDAFTTINKKNNLENLSRIIRFYQRSLNLVYGLYDEDQESHRMIGLYLDNHKTLKKTALPAREYDLLSAQVLSTTKLFELI